MADIWLAKASVADLCFERLFTVVYIILVSSRAGYLHVLYRKKTKPVKPTIPPDRFNHTSLMVPVETQ